MEEIEKEIKQAKSIGRYLFIRLTKQEYSEFVGYVSHGYDWDESTGGDYFYEECGCYVNGGIYKGATIACDPEET